MNCVLIGYGYWGRIVERYIRESEEFRLLGICSRHKEDGVDWRDLADELECAFVCVPTGNHFETVQELLQHRIHVFCEKPLCRTLEETQRLASLAKENGCTLFTDYIYMVSPSVRCMKRYLNQFGKILHIDMAIRQFGRFYPKEHVYETVGVHMLSTLAYLFDSRPIRIERVESVARNGEGYVEAGFVYFNLADAPGRIECSLLAEQKQRSVRILCEKGMLAFDMLGEYTVRAVAFEERDGAKERRTVLEERFDEGNNLTYMIRLFAETIRSGGSENAGITLATAAVLEEICRGLCR